MENVPIENALLKNWAEPAIYTGPRPGPRGARGQRKKRYGRLNGVMTIKGQTETEDMPEPCQLLPYPEISPEKRTLVALLCDQSYVLSHPEWANPVWPDDFHQLPLRKRDAINRKHLVQQRWYEDARTWVEGTGMPERRAISRSSKYRPRASRRKNPKEDDTGGTPGLVSRAGETYSRDQRFTFQDVCEILGIDVKRTRVAMYGAEYRPRREVKSTSRKKITSGGYFVAEDRRRGK